MSKFASQTKVSANKSRDEIEKTLTRYGATGFMYAWQEEAAMIRFAAKERQIQFMLPLPLKSEFVVGPNRKKRTPLQIESLHEQAVRQRWRALALAIKAKLECVESGITTFEDEFLAHIVLPNGTTVGRAMKPQLIEAYTSGKMPPLLEGSKGEATTL